MIGDQLFETAIVIIILVALVLPVSAQQDTLSLEGPAGFVPPPIHPGGVTLRTKPLGNNVYALLSNHRLVDNSGFIVGERGAGAELLHALARGAIDHGVPDLGKGVARVQQPAAQQPQMSVCAGGGGGGYTSTYPPAGK